MRVEIPNKAVTFEALGCKIIQRKWNADDRGRLTEIYRKDDDPMGDKIQQVYTTTVFPGVVKAWHYHKIQTDRFFCIRGTLKVGLYKEVRELLKPMAIHHATVTLSEYDPKVLVIPADVYHGFTAVGNQEAQVINCIEVMYNREHPDEYRIAPFTHDFEFENGFWESRNG